jgi:uncharacterized iron-regulated membrane protein
MFVGGVGVALLLSGIGGLALILLSATSIKRLFKVQTGDTRKTFYDLHRAVGAGTAVLVLLQAFTGVWLCYPQIFRFAVGAPAETQIDVRSRATHSGSLAPLGDLIAATDRAIGDGRIREIRMPEGYGLVQVRMWREGDFRSLGNNVVSVDRASAQVLAVDLYDGKPASNRFLQALAGLHYGEWGGMPYRAIYGISGMATLPLFLTGCSYWWLRRRRHVPATARSAHGSREAIGSSVPTQA